MLQWYHIFCSQSWEYIVALTQLQPGYQTSCHNYFECSKKKKFTHIRLNIYPGRSKVLPLKYFESQSMENRWHKFCFMVVRINSVMKAVHLLIWFYMINTYIYSTLNLFLCLTSNNHYNSHYFFTLLSLNRWWCSQAQSIW